MSSRDIGLSHGRVCFVDEGSGPALVLLHGLGGNWRNWSANIPVLAQSHRVVALDLPGFGDSEPYIGTVTIERYVDTVVELLHRLHIERATFIGNSLGGLLTVEAAARHPERVEAAILVGAGGIPLARLRHRGARAAFNVVRRRRVRKAVAASKRGRRMVARTIVADPTTIADETIAEALNGLAASGFDAAFDAGGKYNARLRAPRMACPTLILWGRQDRLLPVSMSAEYQRLIPDSRLIVWDAAGHCPMIEQPARFNDVVGGLLGGDYNQRVTGSIVVTIRPEVFIAGAFVTPFGKFVDRPLRSIAAEAVVGVMVDTGATPDEIDAVFFANAAEGYLTGQECIRGQVALQGTGLSGKPIVNVENACASGTTAFQLACSAVASGTADVALAVGAEKLTNEDKGRTFAVFDTGWDVERLGRPDPSAKQSAFMGVYANLARGYMQRSGATIEDFAQVSVKSHDCGALNVNAQYRNPLTVDEVLASRVIVDPLTLLMCSPIGDGAAAVVVASPAGLRRLSADPVRMLASALRSGGPGNAAVTRAATEAYRIADVRPWSVDVIEVHDAAAPAELIALDELGIAEPDTGLAMMRAGETSLGGRLPVNPSGGLLSRGHPIGATGCAQIVELTDQLRGRCGQRQVPHARIALAENAGGWLGNGPAVAAVTILGR